MRVLHIIESLDFGGAEKIVVGLANSMLDTHDVAVCCLKNIGVLGAELDPRIQTFCFNKGEGNDYLLPARLAALIRKNHFDIVHTHNWGVFLEGGLAGWLGGARMLLHTVHGPYTDYDRSLQSRLKVALRHTLERFIAQRFDHIVAVSDAIRAYIEQDVGIPPARLLTIHNGIPAIADKPLIYPDRPTVTFMTVGRLAPIKNHAMLLKAFAEIVPAHPQFRLVIVGDGPERDSIENFIRQQGLEAYVWLTGFRSDVPTMLRDADIFVLTSRYEGISLALLEAMRAGLPVIATAVGGIPETVRDGETGVLVGLEDQAALAQNMIALADSKDRCHAMGSQGRDFFAKEFSLAAMLSRYLELYAKIVPLNSLP